MMAAKLRLNSQLIAVLLSLGVRRLLVPATVKLDLSTYSGSPASSWKGPLDAHCRSNRPGRWIPYQPLFTFWDLTRPGLLLIVTHL